MIRLLFLGMMLFFASAHAYAQSPQQEYGATQNNLAVEKKQKAALENKAKAIESEIKSTRNSLVKTANDIQENERILKDVEARIAQLEIRKEKMDASLLEDRRSLARLVLALERLRRVPPEALIAKPGAPLQAAQSALVMQEIMPALYQQAEKLRASLAEVNQIADDLEKKRAKALAASESLEAKHEQLSELVQKREDLFVSTNKDLKTRQENVRRISQQASNLQDLVKRLDSDAKDKNEALRRTSMTPPRPGRARLPISGIIKTAYNEPDNFGAPSRGLTIEGADGALVVSPMGGVVQFAGYFKNYGQMIIIEHQNGYHSLIAGLKKIDTVVGQSVAAGEPLGLLGRGTDGGKPTLYYELRLNGHPVNPAGKFTDLG